MSEAPGPYSDATSQDFAGAFLPGKDGLDREKVLRAADSARLEMEALAAEIRDLVLAQPPIQLLGFVMGHFHIAMMRPALDEADRRPNKEAVKDFQLALEYLHAVWSCYEPSIAETARLDEAQAGKLFPAFERLQAATWRYCMASSAGNPSREPGVADLEFHAKSTWTLIRGNRYQVLEG